MNKRCRKRYLYIIVEHRKSNAKAKLMEVLRCIARSVAKRFQKTLSLYRRNLFSLSLGHLMRY